jgi:hypothetical protein
MIMSRRKYRMALIGLPNVLSNIRGTFERKVATTYALCLEYAARAEAYFKNEQAGNRWWTNRSGQARDRMHGGAEKSALFLSWFLAHGVQYGTYLELANDGRYQAIRPVINYFLPEFKKDLMRIWGHDIL